MTDSADSTRFRIKAIVADAIDLALEARPAWVERACGGDPVLRAEVEALLKAHDRAGAFLEAPALAFPGAARRVVETTEEPAGDHPLPDRFGAYRVLRELGRGGMGVVYLGARDDDRFEKQVAIKVVSGDVVHPAVFRRFEDERRILASLDHPNIARMLDAGTTSLGYYRKGVAIEESLARADASNTELQRRVFVGFVRLGDVSSQLGDRHLAVEQYRRARDEAEKLARADPANLQAQSDLALACTRLGAMLAQGGETDAAFRLLNDAAKLLEPVVARDSANISARSRVAEYKIGLGYAHAALGSNLSLAREARLWHWREAKARFQDGYAFWAEMRDSGATTGEEAAKPDLIAREIAKCDAALGGAR